ncbi:MAG: methyltransferase domain-containing protein [Candidatus Omnitrophica bacterium]|nr:methyltransferase domain-containing protein [Candidatus Omnitrophota bacterium]
MKEILLIDDKLLDKEFVSLTEDFRRFLEDIKENFDKFDKINKDERRQIDFICSNKKKIFRKIDNYFAKAWEIVKDFGREQYIAHKNYYYKILHSLFGEIIEINKHIYEKPLGYPGDYIIMNYIYDYHGDSRFLGNSSYEKLINNYTCNIPISCSNIKRKEFLKEKIIKVLKTKTKAKILSVASGPARELIELLKEGKINKPLSFICLDFEKRALDYVSNEINKIEAEKKQFISIEYICRDIVGVIRDKELKEALKDCDLVYASGILDYLSEKIASRLTKELYQLLQNEGELIICNVSLEKSSHRAYYELLGDWNMVHRTKEQMLDWTKGIENVKEIIFEEPRGGSNYLFLSIKKA